MKRMISLALAAVLLLSACAGKGGSAGAAVDLAAFAQTLQEKYEFAGYLTDLDLEQDYNREMVENTMPGLLELDLEQRVIYMCLITINNGEFALAQAKNAEDAAKVRDSFQARIDYMVGDGESPGGAWYPGPTQLWTDSSRVEVNGNYVMLVCAEECDQIVDEFNALFQ